ncbi:MAG: PASTA domain-containing protein, partial [candidate division KSB1 bacterium]|nr:PASTA domain-containing protein [candidate division KSB1 bacterium]
MSTFSLSTIKMDRLKRPIFFLTGIFLLLLLCDKVVMPLYTKHNEEVEVPNITQISFDEAETILEKQGFQIVKEAEKYDSHFPPGYVLTQNPEAFSKVKSGRRVYVIVSMGERMVKVPQLIGRSERDAQFILNSLGLVLKDVLYDHSSYYPEGVVSEQSLPKDQEVKVGTEISIMVSLGRFPDRFIVPSLVGKNLNQAKMILTKSGLTLGKVEYQVEPELLPETVISQSLPADAE